ncbi:MAG: glycosyltransferase domain-containing protein [Pseudomonadota bacterium]
MRIACYSCLYGDREPLNPRLFAHLEGVDCFVFTDREELAGEGFEAVLDPTHGLDPARASRRAKLMPHRYLADYDVSVYFDNRVIPKAKMLGEVREMVAGSPADFFAFPHPERRCVYVEAEEVRRRGIARDSLLDEQIETYRALGLPDDAGLIAGTFLVRRHNAPALVHFAERWYEHVLRFSQRDQISWGFLAWAVGLPLELIPGSVYRNGKFVWMQRQGSGAAGSRLKVKHARNARNRVTQDFKRQG